MFASNLCLGGAKTKARKCASTSGLYNTKATNREVEPIARNITIDGWYLKAERHTLIVDCFVALGELAHGLVNSLWYAPFDDVRHDNVGRVDNLIGEHTVGSREDCFDERLMRDCNLVVLAEYGHHAIVPQMVNTHSRSVRLNEVPLMISAMGNELHQ